MKSLKKKEKSLKKTSMESRLASVPDSLTFRIWNRNNPESEMLLLNWPKAYKNLNEILELRMENLQPHLRKVHGNQKKSASHEVG